METRNINKPVVEAQNESENNLSDDISDVTEAETIKEAEVETPAGPLLKCDQCEYTNATEKGLSQHKRMKHRICQIDGMDDISEEEVIQKLQEDQLHCEKCKITFKTNAHLKKHIKSNHSLGPMCAYHFTNNSFHETCRGEPGKCMLFKPKCDLEKYMTKSEAYLQVTAETASLQVQT